jgi:hypothetical protein
MVLPGAFTDWRGMSVSSITRLSVSIGSACATTSNKACAKRNVLRLPRSSSL